MNRINNHTFVPGDKIYFAAGETFRGGMVFVGESGTPENPIVVTSFGNGRATIQAETNIALAATNCAGFAVSNLNFIGSGPNISTNDGIRFICELPGNVILPSIVIDRVDVSGFGGSGINIGGWNGASGFRDVRVMNSSSHNNLDGGISIYARVARVNKNVYIGHCEVYDNRGDATHTGNGIVLGGVDGGIVEWCVARNNGKFAGGQGPVGIWAYSSSNIVFQFNESHSNGASVPYDGGGFDFDTDVQNSVMQYNYSHGNEGPGFMLCCAEDNSGNVIRYNISENDSRKIWNGAIHTGGNITGAKIYNNTVYFSRTQEAPAALMLFNGTTGLRIWNNIFVTTGGNRLLWISPGQNDLLLQGNNYWASGSSFLITDSGTDYTSFAQWRSTTGREHLNGQPVGFSLDPHLMHPGAGVTFNNPALLQNLSNYKLRGTSPMIDVGLNLPSIFGQNSGLRDFFGGILPRGNGFDIGAHEIQWAQVLQIESMRRRENAFYLTAVGPLGRTNVLEASLDFSSWTPLQVWTNTNGTAELSDTNVSLFPERFYRLREVR